MGGALDSRVVPHSGHSWSKGPTLAPHSGHFFSTEAGLKHMVRTFLLESEWFYIGNAKPVAKGSHSALTTNRMSVGIQALATHSPMLIQPFS